MCIRDRPTSVTINEAVELAKDFGGEDESHRFVNGILGRIAKMLEGEEGQEADAPSSCLSLIHISPIALVVRNRDWENWTDRMAAFGEASSDLAREVTPRPGPADLVGALKTDKMCIRDSSLPLPLICATHTGAMTEMRRNSSRAEISDRCTSTVGTSMDDTASRSAYE